MKQRDKKQCAQCGKLMSPGRNGRRVYCSDACKQAAYRARRDAAAVTLGSGKGNKEGVTS